jgi:hypothetical protein
MAGVVIAILFVLALVVLAKGGDAHRRTSAWGPQPGWRERDPRS